MAQATVTINGRTYRLRCRPGDEPRILALADRVRARVDALSDEFATAGDDRLLLMAAMMLADELIAAEARSTQASALRQTPAEASPTQPQPLWTGAPRA